MRAIARLHACNFPSACIWHPVRVREAPRPPPPGTKEGSSRRHLPFSLSGRPCPGCFGCTWVFLVFQGSILPRFYRPPHRLNALDSKGGAANAVTASRTRASIPNSSIRNPDSAPNLAFANTIPIIFAHDPNSAFATTISKTRKGKLVSHHWIPESEAPGSSSGFLISQSRFHKSGLRISKILGPDFQPRTLGLKGYLLKGYLSGGFRAFRRSLQLAQPARTVFES